LPATTAVDTPQWLQDVKATEQTPARVAQVLLPIVLSAI
jgi:hypothetical protein